MTRVTAVAPANIAFVKYWGAHSPRRALPLNPSISMTLRRCVTRTTVELLPGRAGRDDVCVEDASGRIRPAGPDVAGRIRAHLRRLRHWAGHSGHFRVVTRNSFPSAAGLASSASGFAALTLATTRALELEPQPRRLSVLARWSGSGSAARSLFGGYVEWPGTDGGRRAAAAPIAPADHWTLCDVIAVVDTAPKAVSSLEGHRRAPSGPFFSVRQARLGARLEAVRAAIRDRDLARLGPALEEEAVELHLMAMSSRPPIFYWKPATLAVLETVRRLRAEAIPAWATMDAGANVHVICAPDSEPLVASALASMAEVRTVVRDGVGAGPYVETGAAADRAIPAGGAAQGVAE